MDIRIELRDREVRDALGRLLSAGTDMSPATKAIAAQLRRIVEDAFAAEADPATGQAWAPLSEVTATRPPDGNKRGERGYANKLKVSGDLVQSIIFDWDATTAVVGTNLKYAATQHFGAAKGEFGRTRRGAPIP